MEVIKSLNFQKAMSILSALKETGHLEYMVVTSTGEKFGEITNTATKRRQSTERKRGFLKGFFDEKIGDMKVGELRTICADGLPDMDISRLQSTVSSYSGTVWGKGSATTAKNAKENAIEILRIK